MNTDDLIDAEDDTAVIALLVTVSMSEIDKEAVGLDVAASDTLR